MMADLTLRQIVAYERSSIVYPDELSDAILNRIEDDPGGRAEAALVRMKVARPHVLISILVGTIRVASAWPTVIGERKERPLQFEGAAANARALAEFLESRSASHLAAAQSDFPEALRALAATLDGEVIITGRSRGPMNRKAKGGRAIEMAALRAVAREVRRQGGEPLDHDAIRELVEVALDRGIPVNRMRIAARTMDLPLGNAVPTSMVKT